MCEGMHRVVVLAVCVGDTIANILVVLYYDTFQRSDYILAQEIELLISKAYVTLNPNVPNAASSAVAHPSAPSPRIYPFSILSNAHGLSAVLFRPDSAATGLTVIPGAPTSNQFVYVLPFNFACI